LFLRLKLVQFIYHLDCKFKVFRIKSQVAINQGKLTTPGRIEKLDAFRGTPSKEE